MWSDVLACHELAVSIRQWCALRDGTNRTATNRDKTKERIVRLDLNETTSIKVAEVGIVSSEISFVLAMNSPRTGR